jgi:hypothetical protein
MEKNNFMILLCMLLVISYSQPTKKGLNHLRKLDTAENETVLIGFDNYTKTPIDNEQNLNLSFNTYFLLKNKNFSKVKENVQDKDYFNNINISSIINYHENEFKNTTPNAIFNCLYNNYLTCKSKYSYCVIKYVCSYNSSGLFVPKKINLTTDFTNDILLNDTNVSYVTTSAEGLKKDITSLDYEIVQFIVMKNATFVSQSPNSFKIKIEDVNSHYFSYDIDYDDLDVPDDSLHSYDSNNIELITKQKKIPCKLNFIEGNKNDGIKDYYLLETKGDNIANYLANTDLKYAIGNYTKRKNYNKMFILDFKDGVNSTIKEKKEYKMSSGGLSTGGIIAVTIPTCALLLGVAGLSFFLSRKNATPPPQIKTMSNMNMQNNTMGVITTSSEAVIHQ